jgi:hypothetical protein
MSSTRTWPPSLIVLERRLWLEELAHRRSQRRVSGLFKPLEQLLRRLPLVVAVNELSEQNRGGLHIGRGGLALRIRSRRPTRSSHRIRIDGRPAHCFLLEWRMSRRIGLRLAPCLSLGRCAPCELLLGRTFHRLALGLVSLSLRNVSELPLGGRRRAPRRCSWRPSTT